METIQVIDQNNSKKTIGLKDLKTVLIENVSADEKDKLPEKTILDKTTKYLEIFVAGPDKQISEKQLLELMANICQEEGLKQTSENILKINLQNIKSRNDNSDQNFPYSKLNREKLKKLYLPPTNNATSTDNLIHRLSFHKVNNETGEQIETLIRKGRFLPHQNVLKTHFPYDQMHIHLEDDLGNIFDQLKQVAINFQNLISTSINFSKLRPKMAEIKSTRGFSSGPVSFIKIYTSTLDSLKQNLSAEFTPMQTFALTVEHPDILEYLIFIKNFKKSSLNKHVKFLIELTPQFLDALTQEEDYHLINPTNGDTVNLLSAKNTFDLIISTILENPQLSLRQNTDTSSSTITEISGIINLEGYKNEKAPILTLKKDLPYIQKYLQKQAQITSKQTHLTPKIRINLTGWNDFLIDQKINYSSINAIELAEELFIELKKTLDSAIDIGVNLHSPLLSTLESSKGIECVDNLVTLKTNLDGQEIHQLHPALKNHLSDLGLLGNNTIKEIFENNSVAEMYKIPTHIKPLFKTSHEIDHQFHLELQKSLESIAGPNIEKRIYFKDTLDQENIKESLIERLKQGIQYIGNLQFGGLAKETVQIQGEPGKNFLMTLKKSKNRKHREIQPPLFQIKKTEEITLPPITT